MTYSFDHQKKWYMKSLFTKMLSNPFNLDQNNPARAMEFSLFKPIWERKKIRGKFPFPFYDFMHNNFFFIRKKKQAAPAVPENVQKKLARDEKLRADKAKARADRKKRNQERRKLYTERAQQYAEEYRRVDRNLVESKRQVMKYNDLGRP